MIVFQRVTYQNFLATGNVPISLDLSQHASTLVVGRNGAGKSTLSEAICFGLFGKALRNITKPSLVNSINQRDCLVELEFTTVSGTYKVRRGIKPAVFEIYHNGTLMPAPANVDDYQETLESIIKLDHKSFKQVVILGSASFVPFMRLTAGQRRDIIEDLLDIEVFSSMNALAKEDLSVTKAALETVGSSRKLIGDQIVMAETFTQHIEDQKQEALAGIDASIATLKQDTATYHAEVAGLLAQLKTYDTYRDQQATALAAQRKYERTLDQLKAKAVEFTKDLAFYEDHANCPECEQEITEGFKQEKFETLRGKKAHAAKAIAQCEGVIESCRTKAEAATQALGAARRLETRVSELSTTLVLYERRLSELAVQRANTLAPNPKQRVVDVDDLRAKLTTKTSEHDALSRQRVIYDAAAMLLKDNGIKTKVIKHYLPIINRLVNHYLTSMDFPILFTFDESFNECMKSRHRDEFVYESFSEGEKKRIDLALLLTWRAVAKLKNSASTNLLILDEVFDSSLDAAGIEEFLKIMAALEAGTNVFVISHRTDQLIDKFAHTINFEKHKQFSRIK